MPPKKKLAPRVPTEKDILDGLQKLHDADSWAFLRQVREKTGAESGRYADAVAMGLWPSRGLELHGFEVKVSRSDWLRELKDPAKAEAVASRCDRWWIVCPAGVIEKNELPSKWGCYIWDGDELKLAQRAELLASAGKDLDRPFVASLLRRAVQDMLATGDSDTELEIRRRLEKREREIIKERQQILDDAREFATRELNALRKIHHDFEAASGLSVNRWSAGNIGNAVKVVMEGGLDRVVKQLDSIKQTHEAAARLLASTMREVGNVRG